MFEEKRAKRFGSFDAVMQDQATSRIPRPGHHDGGRPIVSLATRRKANKAARKARRANK